MILLLSLVGCTGNKNLKILNSNLLKFLKRGVTALRPAGGLFRIEHVFLSLSHFEIRGQQRYIKYFCKNIYSIQALVHAVIYAGFLVFTDFIYRSKSNLNRKLRLL